MLPEGWSTLTISMRIVEKALFLLARRYIEQIIFLGDEPTPDELITTYMREAAIELGIDPNGFNWIGDGKKYNEDENNG